MPLAPSGIRHDNPAAGIGFVLAAVGAISINDMLVKFLSGDYPLHQIIFIRSAIGIVFSLVLVQMEGGLAILRSTTPVLHALRGVLIVIANLTFFTALAAVPLAEATALFFVAPLMITLLSIPLLGEKVGPRRVGAALIGFAGVVIMLRPWDVGGERSAPLLILLMPLVAALTYALNQILTRKLGATTKASALAVHIQGMFVVVSLGFFLVAGDGHFAKGVENESLRFLLRAWTWPEGTDLYLMMGLGLNAAVIGYSLSQAYRLADAATVAPFEYIGLPLAVLWGWLVWGELPGATVTVGIVLIIGSGLFVFLRERQKQRPLAGGRRMNRRY
ncbi:MAG: DMT family transporter [Pseudomonadota bacterium]